MIGKEKIRLVLIVFFLAGILCLSVKSQPKYLQFRQLNIDEGLSSSTIICMLQDHNGFMWIGTADGLNRYDGSAIQVYKHSRLNRWSIPDNLIISILLVGQKMYVGTNAGLSMYDPCTDGFITFSNDSNSCFSNFTFQCRSIVKGPDESLYIASNKGLIHFYPKQNTYQLYPFETINKQNDKGIRIDDLCFDSSNNLWVGSLRGIYLFQSDTKTFEPVNKGINGENYSEVRFNRIVEDKTGVIWCSSYNHGLFRVTKSTDGELQLVNYKHDPDDPKSISKNRLLSLVVDAQNNLWIGAENDGVFLFNPEKQNFSHFLASDSDPLSTTTYSGECLYVDSSENLWIGTFAYGVNIVPKNSDAIVAYSKFKGGDLSLTNNMVNAFAEDESGNIWVGTDGGGVNILNKKTGLFRNLSTNNSNLPSNYILSIEIDNDKIWLSTWGDGLLRYDEKKKKFQSFNTENSDIPSDNIFSILKGQNNDLWLGTYNNGLAHYYPQTNKFISYNTSNSKLNDNYVNVVRMGNHGNILIGTRSGLASFDTKTEEFTAFSLLDLDAKTLSNQHVYDIFVENDTSVWVATLSGLNQLNPETGVNFKYSVKDGLPSNNVRGILKDDLGGLWFSTRSGICKWDGKLKNHIILTKDDGLQGNEFRPRSQLISSEGDLYFGGVNGFSIVHPDRIKKNTRIPRVQLTDLEIWNEKVVLGSEGSPLKRIITETEELKIRYNQSVVTFHFSVLDFTRPQKNQHAYMLENFDEDWIYSGESRKATYTNLDPGEYVFRVKGSNNDGIWNEQGVALDLVVVPPWWATWWFKSSLVLILLLIALSVYFIRVSSLKKQKKKLEITVQNRTRELAQINATKDKLFSIIAHDLRSPFNTILGFTNVLLENYDDLDKKMIHRVLNDLKKSGENAFSLLENLLTWSQTQQNRIDFKPISISVDSYLHKINQEFNLLSKRKDIEIIDKVELGDGSVFADTNMLSLIFRNLLSNAIKFSRSGSKVSISAQKSSNGWITFCVKDTGLGIANEKLKTLFDLGEHESVKGTQGEKGTGLGLILCKEFVEKHKGRIWVESEVGKGSSFYFTIPTSEKVFNQA